MFNKLFQIVNECGLSNPLGRVADTMTQLENLIEHIEDNYSKGEGLSNAAIDAICEILQAHKTKE